MKKKKHRHTKQNSVKQKHRAKKQLLAKELKKERRWQWGFLLIFVFAMGGGYFWTQKHFYSESEIVKAVITKTLMRRTGGYGNKILEVKYQYTIGGVTYTGTENTFHFELRVGDTIDVEVSREHNDVSQMKL